MNQLYSKIILHETNYFLQPNTSTIVKYLTNLYRIRLASQ